MEVTVIGGLGRLGKWITEFLKKENFNVSISTPDIKKYQEIIKEIGVKAYNNNIEAVKTADVIIVSVPLHKTIEVIEEILPFLKEDSILVEIASLKNDILKLINNKKNYLVKKKINFLSIHPMFGPGAKSLKNQNIILIKSDYSAKIFDQVSDYLDKHQANLAISSYDNHDKKIAYTLGISHFTLLLFSSILKKAGNLKELDLYGGSTFRILNFLTMSLINESWELYSHIQMDNIVYRELMEEYKDNFMELFNIVKSLDFGKFKSFWEKNVSSLRDMIDLKKINKKIYDILDEIK
jgi:prephenate dehydrogenase